MERENLVQSDSLSSSIANPPGEQITPEKINTDHDGQPATTPLAQHDPQWPTGGQERPGRFQHHHEAQNPNRETTYEKFNLNRLNEAAADLQEHLSKRNSFERFTEDQRQAILALLKDYPSRTVAAILAEPPPRGLGFTIGKTALNNFRNRHAAIATSIRRQANYQAAADLLDKSENPETIFQKTIDRDLKMRLLTASADPDSDHRSIATLITAYARFQRQTQSPSSSKGPAKTNSVQ